MNLMRIQSFQIIQFLLIYICSHSGLPGGAFAYWVHYVRNSELFLGQRCLEIYESEYVTDKEKKEMFKDFYSVALCPKKYRDSPQALRERIRKNEAIIYEREVQSCFKKGVF